MKQLIAFTKKEFTENLRGGKLIILGILFCLFGIMNPALAKMIPWLLETMSDQLAETGMIITEIEVNALTSWTQFFKNMPILLIAFFVMFSGTLTTEYQKGTLINIITKGLKRWKIIISKQFTMSFLWTLGCLITFGITYCYNMYFWDNSIVHNLLFSVFGYYLIGLWLISIITLSSAFFKSQSAVILSAGGAFIISYLLSFVPIFQEYMPTFLLSSNELMTGTISSSQCMISVGVTSALIIINVLLSIKVFNKKKI